MIVWPSAVPLETDLLYTNRFAMVGLAMLAQDLLGSNTLVAGFPCSPGTGLAVSVGAGRIYSLQNLENTAYSSLPADTAHQVLKQGINLDPTVLSCPAPATSGQSINYLVEVAYADSDTNTQIVQYYDAANPTQPYTGPNNTGAAQPSFRQGVAALQIKAGVAATTGTQTTPSVDTGYTGLWVVTVANGASSIVTGNIAAYGGAPVTKLSLGAAQSTGWGTPTNGAVASNFAGSSATLAQVGSAVSQLIAVLKNLGIVGA
jgi:hypothetical protein